MSQIEQAVRRATERERGVQSKLTRQNQAIGALYEEFAMEMEKQGDHKRAGELLMTAARVDPNNASLYLDKRRRLGGEEKEKDGTP